MGRRGQGEAAETTARANGAALLKRRYVPLAALLPRCRALVHHGGIGTASLAYAAGVPQVVTPFAHDQFDNAQRVAASGCGVRLDAPVRGEPLARALARVLGDAAMAARCAEVRARMAAQPDGCDEAARFIERFVRAVARDVHRSAGLDGGERRGAGDLGQSSGYRTARARG